MSVRNSENVAPHVGPAAQAVGGGCVSCSRRQFVSDSILLAASALLLDACGDGVIGGGGSQVLGNVDFTITLSAYPALATVGGIARINGTSTPIAVARTGATTYLAFSMICPHEGTTIGINGAGFLCPNHGARFDNTGTWVQSQQRTTNLSRVATTLDAAAGTLRLGGV